MGRRLVPGELSQRVPDEGRLESNLGPDLLHVPRGQCL